MAGIGATSVIAAMTVAAAACRVLAAMILNLCRVLSWLVFATTHAILSWLILAPARAIRTRRIPAMPLGLPGRAGRCGSRRRQIGRWVRPCSRITSKNADGRGEQRTHKQSIGRLAQHLHSFEKIWSRRVSFPRCDDDTFISTVAPAIL